MAIAVIPFAEFDTEASVEGVEQLEHECLSALIARDAGALDELWSDDFWMTLPDGTRLTKADCLAGLHGWAISCELVGSDEPRIRLYSDAALVQGRAHLQGRLGRDDLDIVVRYIAMYSRRGNRWRQVATAITRVLVLAGPPVVRALDEAPGCGPTFLSPWWKK